MALLLSCKISVQIIWKNGKQKRLSENYQPVLASTVGCDVVVFLVFNDFSTGQNTDGHKVRIFWESNKNLTFHL